MDSGQGRRKKQTPVESTGVGVVSNQEGLIRRK
jgi:hypothetical protein